MSSYRSNITSMLELVSYVLFWGTIMSITICQTMVSNSGFFFFQIDEQDVFQISEHAFSVNEHVNRQINEQDYFPMRDNYNFSN